MAKEIIVMNKRLFFPCLVLAVLHVPDRAFAQFNDPRAYENTPVGTNQLELGYTYVHSNTSLDTSLVVAGAKLNVNQGIIDYTHYFGFFHHLMWVEAGVPVAGLSGSVSGTNIQGSTWGTGDSSYAFGVLLKGGPALSVEQFKDYQPATTLGLSLIMTAPTGSYQPSRILNLGSDRWSFKPELAWSHPFGHEQQWELDAYANVSFYTDNTSYHGKEILRQDPLPGIEGHLSYSFTDNIWASFDTRYSFRGTTTVDGVPQNNAQQNFILGTELTISVNPRNTLIFEFAKAVVHNNGPSDVGFSLRYDYTWAKSAGKSR
jgi:hypothetical protein